MTANDILEKLKDSDEIGIELKKFNGDFITISSKNMDREVVSIVVEVR